MHKETAHIIEDVVKSLNFSERITSVADNGDGSFTIYLRNTYHIQPLCGVKFSINGNIYRAKKVENNNYIVIDTTMPPAIGDYVEIPMPNYIYGTFPAVQNEINNIRQRDEKVPLIYLFEVINERNYVDESSVLQRESPVRLFFLSDANIEEWRTEDHYLNTIIPMRNLLNEFINAIRDDEYTFGRLSDFTTVNHARFGVTTEKNGHIVSLLNENLSGIELQLTIPINKCIECNGCLNL